MQLNAYLHFEGQCAAAFKFYQECLGGKNLTTITHGDSPLASKVAPEWHNKIMHARLEIGDTVLMGCDAPPEHYRKPQGFRVSITVEKPEDAERIFGALAEKGSVQMPLQETFWSPRFGMLVDQFGTPWMVNCEGATGHAEQSK